MPIKIKCLKKVVALACVVMILAYASVAFLPHTHQCTGSDCTVCETIEASRDILIGIALSGAAYQASKFGFIIISNADSYVISAREATLVGLKVKLSD